MVITVIALLALIIVVMARKNQKDKKHMIEHQILQLTKFKGDVTLLKTLLKFTDS